MLHNVPEGQRGDNYGCANVAKLSFKRTRQWVRDRYQCSSPYELGQGDNQQEVKPRTLHACCVFRNDQERILRKAPAKLPPIKIKVRIPYKSDDINPETCPDHNKLVPIMKKLRKEGHLAFIPCILPRVIKYRKGPRPVILNKKGPTKTSSNDYYMKSIQLFWHVHWTDSFVICR